MTAVLNGKAASRCGARSAIPPVGDGGPRGLGCDGRRSRGQGPLPVAQPGSSFTSSRSAAPTGPMTQPRQRSPVDMSPAEHPEAAPPWTAPAQRGEVPGAPGVRGLGFKPHGLGSPSFPLSQRAPAGGGHGGRAGLGSGGLQAAGRRRGYLSGGAWPGRPGSSGGQKRPRRLVESDGDVVASGQSRPVRSRPCRAPAPRAHDAERGLPGWQAQCPEPAFGAGQTASTTGSSVRAFLQVRRGHAEGQESGAGCQ